MKLKYIYKYILITYVALLLGACTSTEVEQKFDQTPLERTNAQKNELNALLLSSAEGWKLIYYTDSTQLGGFTHLFKFLPNGNVDMASDFDSDTSIHRSQYDLQLASTVSLVFTTANRIHLLSESSNFPTSDLVGQGYLGDFQFFYYGQENGEIIFKTNRNFKEIRFVKATAQDWEDLTKNTPIIEAITGDIDSPLFRLLVINDGQKIEDYEFDFNSAARFGTAYSLDPNSDISYNFSLRYTPTGAIIKPALVVKGQKLSNFIYDSGSNTFVATGTGGVTATIKYTRVPPVLTDDYKVTLPEDNSPENTFGYIAANLADLQTNSPLAKQLLREINSSLPSGQKVNRVQISFYPGGKAKITYSFIGGKAPVYHNVSVTEDPINKTVILEDINWNDGAVIIPAPALLQNIDNQLLDPKGLYVKKENFTVRFTNTIYTFTSASGSFRITTYAFQ